MQVPRGKRYCRQNLQVTLACSVRRILAPGVRVGRVRAVPKIASRLTAAAARRTIAIARLACWAREFAPAPVVVEVAIRRRALCVNDLACEGQLRVRRAPIALVLDTANNLAAASVPVRRVGVHGNRVVRGVAPAAQIAAR